MIEYYDMMFKRKSFRRFNSELAISTDELAVIDGFIGTAAERFSKDLALKYKIVPSRETSCKRGEYCILIYSAHENRNLLNIGYVFAQLDFYLSTCDIGSCWYGIGKPLDSSSFEGLPYVIMIAIGKATKEEFRKNYKTAKRKSDGEISSGEISQALIDYVKYSPSACNSQPWILNGSTTELSLQINSKEKMLIPKDKISFYNTIDMGIMMFSCEMWLKKNDIHFTRVLSDVTESFVSGDEVVRYRFD